MTEREAAAASEREAFETAMRKQGLSARDFDKNGRSDYIEDSTQLAWAAWQAALSRAPQQTSAASERDGLRLGWTPPSPQRFDFDPKKPKPDHFMAYTVMQLHAAFDAGRALSRAPQAVRMLTDKDLYELWSQHWDGSDSVPYAFLAALGIVPLAPQEEGEK
jgi:hypothetical protein